MREHIKQWGDTLDRLVAEERGGKRFKDVQRPHEYIEVMGHDLSILQFVVQLGFVYYTNLYTRVVWSERYPAEQPFAFYQYHTKEFVEKPKQEWHNDRDSEPKLLPAHEVQFCLFYDLIQDKVKVPALGSDEPLIIPKAFGGLSA